MTLLEQVTNLKNALAREKHLRLKVEKQLKQKSRDFDRISRELRKAKKHINKRSSSTNSAIDVVPEIELIRLQEERDNLRVLVENSPVGLILSKPKGSGAVLSNRVAATMFGFAKEELVNRTIAQGVHKADLPRIRKELNAMHKGIKDRFSLEARFLTKTNEIVWVKLSHVAVHDTSGKIIYEVGTLENISKEKEVTNRLEQSDFQLTNLVGGLPIGIMMENEEGKITLINQKFRDIFDLQAPEEEFIDVEAFTVIEQCKSKIKNSDLFILRIREILNQNTMCLREQISLVDGQVFERNYIPLSYRGKESGGLWSYKNITQTIAFERELFEQQEKYATVIANMNLGWTETDENGILLKANKSFFKLTEYSQKELIGKHIAKLLLIGPSRRKLKYYRDKEVEKYKLQDVQIKTKSGKIKHLLISALRSYDNKGKMTGTMGIQFDVTRQKKLQLQKEILLKELEVQNEQLNDYAHVVSHDLKSPLQSISALIAWTREDFSNNLWDAGLKNLTLIEERVEKMDRLIENILKYSSLTNTGLNNVDVDLHLIVQEILDMMFISKKIEVKITKKLPVICADAARMQQLFQNLLSNAVNHVDKEKGRIEIDFMDTETHHHFAVKDNGKGIMKKYHDKIFKVFKSFDDREMSTGIGLSIVKKIVDQYDGEVWLESEIGLGSAFFFTLKKQL